MFVAYGVFSTQCMHACVCACMDVCMNMHTVCMYVGQWMCRYMKIGAAASWKDSS